MLRDLDDQARPAVPTEQQVLARWGSWGAVPQIFDETRPEFTPEREQLRELLSPAEYRAAERTTINAHYTHHAYATAMWQALTDLGLSGGTVLEPGCGAGVFLGTAPPGTRMIGVEVDPVTAAIAQHLHPEHLVYTESFADTPLADSSFDAVIGNVPFADIRLHDPGTTRTAHHAQPLPGQVGRAHPTGRVRDRVDQPVHPVLRRPRRTPRVGGRRQ